MGYDHRKCEDEQDARRMAETILRELETIGHYEIGAKVPRMCLVSIARNAERIARWARSSEPL